MLPHSTICGRHHRASTARTEQNRRTDKPPDRRKQDVRSQLYRIKPRSGLLSFFTAGHGSPFARHRPGPIAAIGLGSLIRRSGWAGSEWAQSDGPWRLFVLRPASGYQRPCAEVRSGGGAEAPIHWADESWFQ